MSTTQASAECWPTDAWVCIDHINPADITNSVAAAAIWAIIITVVGFLCWRPVAASWARLTKDRRARSNALEAVAQREWESKVLADRAAARLEVEREDLLRLWWMRTTTEAAKAPALLSGRSLSAEDLDQLVRFDREHPGFSGERENSRATMPSLSDWTFVDPSASSTSYRNGRGRVLEDWDDVRDTRRLIVLGDPGTGKSWLLAREAQRLASDAHKQSSGDVDNSDELEIVWPLWARLDDLAYRLDGGDEFWVAATRSALRSTWPDNGPADRRQASAIVKLVADHIKSGGRVCLLLDALDEVPDRYRRSAPGHVGLDQRLRQATEEADQVQIIITSRRLGYSNPLQFAAGTSTRPDPTEAEIQLVGFSAEQVSNFIDSWFAGEPPRAESVRQLLERYPQLADMTTLPLFSAFLCLAAESLPTDLGQVPTDRIRLYDAIIDRLIQRPWKIQKPPSAAESEMRRRLLRQLAWDQAVHSDGWRDRVDGSWARARINELCTTPDSGVTWTTAATSDRPEIQRAESELLELAGCLVPSGEASSDSYFFAHRTIQEFLVAEHLIAPDSGLDTIREIERFRWFQPDWFEAIAVSVQLAEEPIADQIIQHIAQGRPDTAFAGTLLATHCLTNCSAEADDHGIARRLAALAPVYRPAFRSLIQLPQVKAQEAVVDLLTNRRLRREAAEALGPAIPEARHALLDLLNGDDYSRLAAAQRLGPGIPEAREALLGFVRWDGALGPEAAETLADSGDPESHGALLALTHESNSDVRLCAAEALGSSEPEARRALLELVGDDSDAVRLRAAEALGVDEPEAHRTLLELVISAGGYISRNAAISLAQSDNVDARRSLVALTDSGDADLSLLVAKTVGPEVPRARRALLRLTHESDREVRLDALRALTHSGGDDLHQILRDLTEHGHNDVRWQAATILGVEAPEARRALLEVTFDMKTPLLADSAIAAAKSLASCDDLSTSAALIDLTSHESLSVRWIAAEGLGPEVAEARQVFLELLQHPDNNMRLQVAETLGADVPEARQVLLELAKYPIHVDRSRVMRALGQSNHVLTIRGIIGLLYDEDIALRKAAAYALGSGKGPETREAFVRLLGDDDEDLRRLAVRALAADRDPEVREALARSALDADENVRREVALALANSGVSRERHVSLHVIERDDFSVAASMSLMTHMARQQPVASLDRFRQESAAAQASLETRIGLAD